MGLRAMFVQHEGKRELSIFRPDFSSSTTAAGWASVFPEFTGQIQQHVGDLIDRMVPSFSTSTPVSTIAFQIGLMDTFQEYFTYVVRCGCGIPSITLRGTISDWQTIRVNAECLKDYKLDWWLAELLPVLDEFVPTARGNPNPEFWASICNYAGGSGMATPITGWLSVLYPYLYAAGSSRGFEGGELKLTQNRHLQTWRQPSSRINAPRLKDIPGGISKAPLELQNIGTGLKQKLNVY